MSSVAEDLYSSKTFSDESSRGNSEKGFGRLAYRTGVDMLEVSSPALLKKVEFKLPLWLILDTDLNYSVLVEFDGVDWFSEVKELNVFSHGKTDDEALGLIKDQLEYFKKFYQDVDDSELTEGAIRLKIKFSSL